VQVVFHPTTEQNISSPAGSEVPKNLLGPRAGDGTTEAVLPCPSPLSAWPRHTDSRCNVQSHGGKEKEVGGTDTETDSLE